MEAKLFAPRIEKLGSPAGDNEEPNKVARGATVQLQLPIRMERRAGRESGRKGLSRSTGNGIFEGFPAFAWTGIRTFTRERAPRFLSPTDLLDLSLPSSMTQKQSPLRYNKETASSYQISRLPHRCPGLTPLSILTRSKFPFCRLHAYSTRRTRADCANFPLLWYSVFCGD